MHCTKRAYEPIDSIKAGDICIIKEEPCIVHYAEYVRGRGSGRGSMHGPKYIKRISGTSIISEKIIEEESKPTYVKDSCLLKFQLSDEDVYLLLDIDSNYQCSVVLESNTILDFQVKLPANNIGKQLLKAFTDEDFDIMVTILTWDGKSQIISYKIKM